MKNDIIDFVILWVDGNDPNWLKEKNNYTSKTIDNNQNRFRDWDNLQYLFRSIEKNTNWVNKIYFITWGHVPKWLNTLNERLVIVKHEDFIPKDYLPTFNSNVIEINLHRIQSLSEKFVLLNDDIFFLKNMDKNAFFTNDLPNDMFVELEKKKPSKRHLCMKKNYLNIINKYFSKPLFIKNHFNKYINFSYGLYNLKTLSMLKKTIFSDFLNNHMSQSFLKSTFYEVWKNEGYNLNIACKNKFRSDTDIGATLCRYWQLISGNFYPNVINGKYFSILNDNTKLFKTIENKKYSIICINDDNMNIDYQKTKTRNTTSI